MDSPASLGRIGGTTFAARKQRGRKFTATRAGGGRAWSFSTWLRLPARLRWDLGYIGWGNFSNYAELALVDPVIFSAPSVRVVYSLENIHGYVSTAAGK